tara:strand:+ start:157 stop:396 length:240 start_codon:yes stop_codon:yes gene_type:complete
MTVGNLEPEENVMDALEEELDQPGRTYPITTSTLKLMGDLAKALHDIGWSPDDEYEVQVAGTFKKDKFLCIKNRSLETK